MKDNPYEWLDECLEEDYLQRMIWENEDYIKDYIVDKLDESDIEALKEKIINENSFLSIVLNSNYEKVTFSRNNNGNFYLEWVLNYSSKILKWLI